MGEEQKPSAFDLERMFLGTETDWLFLLEIAVRTSIIYVFALLFVRFLGKRGQGRLSPFEFVIIIALGSATGDPMFYPDVPIFHAMIVIALVVLFTRILFQVSEWSETFENFVESRPACLVSDGIVRVPELRRENIAHDELMTALREAGIENLGQVRRSYLEPSGNISTFLFAPRETRQGLPIYPGCDDLHPLILAADQPVPDTGVYACRQCGTTRSLAAGTSFPACTNCGDLEWSPATQAPDTSRR
jgi:uncharacterized membrane protein YcaP (DUF421 family)